MSTNLNTTTDDESVILPTIREILPQLKRSAAMSQEVSLKLSQKFEILSATV
jgi:hypothetical protein